MPIKSFATNNNLLTYGLSSEPDPIGVSPGVATINIVVSNTTGAPIWCDEIRVEYPIGPDAQQMTTDEGTIAAVVSPRSWRLKARDPGLITFIPTETEHAKFTTDGLLLQLTGIAVNAQVGTFILGVSERSHTGTDPYTAHRNDYQLSKFPYDWFLSDFAPLVPQVQVGQPAVLSWQSSIGGKLDILYGNRPPVDVSAGPPFTSVPLAVDTVFVLRASLQIGGETIEHYLSTSVTVANPALTASTLTVSGRSTLNGLLEVTDDAHVTGAVTTTSLSTSGAATVGGALTADSVTSAHDLTVRGTLNGGTAALDNLTVRGTLNGPSGRVALLAPGAKLLDTHDMMQFSFSCGTDSYMLVQASNSLNDPVVAMATVSGNHFYLGGSAAGKSITVPLPAGTDFTIRSFFQSSVRIEVWCSTISGHHDGEQTFQILSSEELAEAVPVPPDFTALADRRTEAATVFLDRLTEALGASLPDDARADLTRRLLAL
ncbi:hypothetical protein [Catenulispora subtropica]|uniref:Uncharacterized protein n=1 Tax=Catenulispora subtropica TaxID=450798 RepID=A0ABN2QRU5_9ACTN